MRIKQVMPNLKQYFLDIVQYRIIQFVLYQKLMLKCSLVYFL